MNLENFLNDKGLIRISSLNQVIFRKSKFLVDTMYAEDDKLAIYPILKKRHLVHDLLNLYGTHWRYTTAIPEWEANLERREGDSHVVFKNLREGKKDQRHGLFAFTQQYVRRFGSLWVFDCDRDNDGLEFRNNALVPMFQGDNREYKQMKNRIKSQLT
ncbi:hypothetical protein HOC01_03550 [archaeon]|jgi:hypothetical protein|nr:hypothetical protein [archaeon]MBT6698513.1 hypothetical protein [archaeon]